MHLARDGAEALGLVRTQEPHLAIIDWDLKAIPGVANAVVNLATEKASITTNGPVGRAVVVKAVEDAGYAVSASFTAPAAACSRA